MTETLKIPPLSRFSFDVKDPQPEEDPSVASRLLRLQDQYEQHGVRRTVEGVILVHDHGHPHVLVLQVANAYFKLPGDYLHPEDNETAGLIRRLDEKLSADSFAEAQERGEERWSIGQLLAMWYRPNFETFMYPFMPVHISRPKEIKQIFLVDPGPGQTTLYVPRNMKILAVPLIELYDNSARYGPQLAGLPHALSRYSYELSAG